MKRLYLIARDGYFSDLVVAWVVRTTLILSLLAVMASLVGCKSGGTIDLLVKGSAAPAPPTEGAGLTN